MKERSCVYKFVERSQRSFVNGGSLNDVFSTVPQHKKIVKRVYGPTKKNFVHNIFTSSIGLNFLATYEFARHKGLPFPNANTIIQTVLPIKKQCTFLLFREKNMIDLRSEQIDF